MKKLCFIPAIAVAMLFTSCNDNKAGSGGVSAAAQKNLDANHGIQKAFETKDFSKLGDYIVEDAVDHAGEKGDVKGLANLKTEFEKMSAMTENDKTEIIKEMADDDYVMCWARYSGKMKQDGMGMKAGDNYSMGAVEVSKYRDGKAIEHWSFMDMADMMKMMPPMPPGGSMPAMPMDTTKKDTTRKM